LAVPLSTPGLWITGLERGIMLAGLALALGGLAGQAVARNYKETAPAPLPESWAVRGCLIGLAAAAALIITALIDPKLATNLARPLVPGPRGSATLVIASLEVACFAAAAILLRVGKSGPGTQALLGVVFFESLRAHPEGLIPLAGALLTICHLLPAVVWVGMLAYILRAAVAWRADPVAMQALIRLYGNAAAWLFATVVVTGLLSAVLLVPLHSLLTTDYGRFLIVKSALVVVVAGLAIAGRAALNRRVEAGAGPALVTKVECGMLAAVLLVTGLLTVITPPPKGIFGHSQAAISRAAHDRHPGLVGGSGHTDAS
jgi:copper transport protein